MRTMMSSDKPEAIEEPKPEPLTLASAEKHCRRAFEDAWRPARHLIYREQRSGLQCPPELMLSKIEECTQGAVSYTLDHAIAVAKALGEGRRKKIKDAGSDLDGLVYIVNLDLEITHSLHGGVKLLEIGYVCNCQTADTLTKNDNILAGQRTMAFQQERKKARRVNQHNFGEPIRRQPR